VCKCEGPGTLIARMEELGFVARPRIAD
jgi:hypothetical protein